MPEQFLEVKGHKTHEIIDDSCIVEREGPSGEWSLARKLVEKGDTIIILERRRIWNGAELIEDKSTRSYCHKEDQNRPYKSESKHFAGDREGQELEETLTYRKLIGPYNSEIIESHGKITRVASSGKLEQEGHEWKTKLTKRNGNPHQEDKWFESADGRITGLYGTPESPSVGDVSDYIIGDKVHSYTDVTITEIVTWHYAYPRRIIQDWYGVFSIGDEKKPLFSLSINPQTGLLIEFDDRLELLAETHGEEAEG